MGTPGSHHARRSRADFRALLAAGELGPGRDRTARLQCLKAQVTPRRDDCGGSVDESRALEDREGFHRDVELEPVECTGQRSVPVLCLALDGPGRRVEAAEVGGQSPPLQLSLGSVLRPIALTVGLWNRPGVLLG